MNKHHFTYVNLTEQGTTTWRFDRFKQPTFLGGTHPLHDLCERLLDSFDYKSVDHMSINPAANAVRIVSLMMHDTYNNGTGNASYWNKAKEFKQSIRKAGYDKETVSHLEKLYSNVLHNISRGKNFGWVRTGSVNCLMSSLEVLQTELTYQAAKQAFPEELAQLEKNHPVPYKLPE